MSSETEHPIVAERCAACGGFRTLRTFAGYDKAVCRSTPECMAQLLEEAKATSDAVQIDAILARLDAGKR